MIEEATLSTPLGAVKVGVDGGRIVRVRFEGKCGAAEHGRAGAGGSALTELREYFAGTRRTFTVEVGRPEATPFQHRVWDALLRIPFGRTVTYGELARELGTSPRAVGGACARNEVPIVIPCHRVVAKSGLGGFSGEWETGLALSVKAALLRHEREVLERADDEEARAG